MKDFWPEIICVVITVILCIIFLVSVVHISHEHQVKKRVEYFLEKTFPLPPDITKNR